MFDELAVQRAPISPSPPRSRLFSQPSVTERAGEGEGTSEPRTQGGLRPQPNRDRTTCSWVEWLLPQPARPKEHAVKSFVARFGALILSVLSGFDRLRFCGDSRL